MTGPSPAGRLKAPLKAMRAAQPLNALVTALVRASLRASGLRSEWVIRHLHRVGPVGAPLPNGRTLRLWSRGDDWVSNQIYWRGWAGYEPETARVFFRLAERARVTLDVGAYVGYYALLAAYANPSGRVFAFEPLPEAQERLRRHVALNALVNVECVPCAVAAREGRAPLYRVPSALPTSSSLSLAFMRPAGELDSVSVPVTTLDAFVRERGLTGIDLLKVDTESTEPEVLAGAAETLERERPAILCEVLAGRATGEALARRLGPLGYRYFLLTDEGPLRREAIEGHPRWLNYLFEVPR